MQQLPQTASFNQLHLNDAEVLAKLSDGPVVLVQEDKPAAVLVSPVEWDRIARRLARLEQEKRDRLDADRAAAIFVGNDANKAKLIRTAIEEGLQRARDHMTQHGPLASRRLLTAEEYENGEGDESSVIRGSELRKVLIKRGMSDDVR